VPLTHGAWTYTAAAIDALHLAGPEDLNFLWLPLAHAFGKVMLALALLMGFRTAIDGRVDKIIDNLETLRPTVMGAVPRIFEKAHAAIEDMPPSKRREEEGLRLGDRRGPQGLRGTTSRPPAVVAAGDPVQDRRPAVFSTIRERLGGRLRLFVSAAAPLDRDVAEWFRRHRDKGARRLRADRDVGRVVYEIARGIPVGHGWLAVPLNRGEDRR